MRKLMIFIIFVVLLAFWFKNFVQSGQLEKYFDTHPNPELNPVVEYYWGMLLNAANKDKSAAYRFHRVVEKYPKSEYAPRAWAEYIELLDNMGDRGKVLEESKKFLESEYASSPKAEIIKRKIGIIEHGF